uniref:Uncharacterized protein n=1 Tax=Rangifer tarandus platyrhynchus TaxID=3082113 RepID=A0ACB0EYS3_RANTA|nr:unnamed protein product [Rangifer tarandus platyrhynchus]
MQIREAESKRAKIREKDALKHRPDYYSDTVKLTEQELAATGKKPRYRVSPAAASSSASLLSLSPTPSLDAFPSHVFSFRCQASHTGSSDRLEEATKRPSLHFLSCRTLCLLLMLGSGPPSSPASLATEDSSTAGKTDRSFSPSQACAVGPGVAIGARSRELACHPLTPPALR